MRNIGHRGNRRRPVYGITDANGVFLAATHGSARRIYLKYNQRGIFGFGQLNRMTDKIS